jgi:hypothetical protein
MVAPVIPEFQSDLWSTMDLTDLRHTLARGGSIEDVAIFLCHRDTHDRVRLKAEGMGWWPTPHA